MTDRDFAFGQDMLRRRWGEVRDFHPLTEGLASQAFGFRLGDIEHVIRVNESIETFHKDEFVSRQFAGPNLPIPEILEIGSLETGPAFCISYRAPGVRLYDLKPSEMERWSVLSWRSWKQSPPLI